MVSLCSRYGPTSWVHSSFRAGHAPLAGLAVSCPSFVGAKSVAAPALSARSSAVTAASGCPWRRSTCPAAGSGAGASHAGALGSGLDTQHAKWRSGPRSSVRRAPSVESGSPRRSSTCTRTTGARGWPSAGPAGTPGLYITTRRRTRAAKSLDRRRETIGAGSRLPGDLLRHEYGSSLPCRVTPRQTPARLTHRLATRPSNLMIRANISSFGAIVPGVADRRVGRMPGILHKHRHTHLHARETTKARRGRSAVSGPQGPHSRL